MKQNKHFSRKDIPHCSTPKNLSINKNKKSINYNKSNSNNNNIFNTKISLSNNFIIPPEYTIDNSSDINFYSSSSSLKDQILSPGDDDLYLYSKNNKNNKQKKNQYVYSIHNNPIDKNKQNSTNELETNYYLNYNMNTTNFKSIDNNNKKTLILDLDETLVHSSFHPLYVEGDLIQPDIFFTILFERKTYDVYVLKRPYIKEFLNKMSKIYNIYIFTASIKEYASPLLLKLDEKKLVSKALFRENCTLSKDNKYIKDLHILEEDLKNVILIDNNPNSYRYNKCNGIPIKTWHFDKSDKELIKIIPFLTFLALVDDVREYIPKVVDDDQVNYFKIKNIINNSTINNIIKKDTTIKNKRIINKMKKHKIINNSYNNNNNSNNNFLNSNETIKYYPNYTNNEENNLNMTGNSNRKKENLNVNKSKNQNQNQTVNEIDDNNNIENNNFYTSNINFNKLEERKNNNYNTVLSHRKSPRNPATINFREPISHFQSSIYVGYKNQVDNQINNKMILNNGNININKTNRNDENDMSKYQRSKSSNNFNELTRTMHKFTSINFNLMNSQTNNKKMKYSIDSKNIQQNNNIQLNDIHKIYENKNMAEKCLSYNNLMDNRVNNNKNIENSLYLENNDPILVTYIQNNNINFNTNNNIMSINLKDDNSNKNLLYKGIKESKTQRTNNYNNKLITRHKSVSNNNIYRNKNNLYKKSIKEKGNINNNERKSAKNKKIKKLKNNDYNHNKKNYNSKNINNIKVNEFKNKKINTILNNYESINDKNYMDENINNDYNFNKKVRSQTLNGHPISSRIYTKFEENKNSTMEISKTIKKKFYNNYLKDNYDNTKTKNSAINYNSNKQKNHRNILNRKNEHLNNEINLLNTFMKDFNKDQKEISYLFNYQIMSKELSTQRLPRMGNRKKNVNSLINFNYNSEKFINSNSKTKNKGIEEEKYKDNNISKNDFINKKNYEQNNDKENFYTNFYKGKTKAYIISKETDNCIMKKMKNLNLDDYYSNDIKFDNISNNDDSDSIKNIKYLSLQKEKLLEKNEKLFKKMKLNNNEGINNNKNIRRIINYSNGYKKNMKDLIGSRTINN